MIALLLDFMSNGLPSHFFEPDYHFPEGTTSQITISKAHSIFVARPTIYIVSYFTHE